MCISMDECMCISMDILCVYSYGYSILIYVSICKRTCVPMYMYMHTYMFIYVCVYVYAYIMYT